MTVECERCCGTGWAMDHPDDDFVPDRAVPCPLCDRTDYEKYRRGEQYYEVVWVEDD